MENLWICEKCGKSNPSERIYCSTCSRAISEEAGSYGYLDIQGKWHCFQICTCKLCTPQADNSLGHERYRSIQPDPVEWSEEEEDANEQYELYLASIEKKNVYPNPDWEHIPF